MNEMEKEIRRIRVSLSRLNKLLKEPVSAVEQVATQNPNSDIYNGLIAEAIASVNEIYAKRAEEIEREMENIRWHLKQLNTLAKGK